MRVEYGASLIAIPYFNHRRLPGSLDGIEYAG